MNIYSNTAKILISFMVTAILFVGVLVYILGNMNAVTTAYQNLGATQYTRLELFQELSSNGLLGGVATRNKVFKPKYAPPYKVMMHTNEVFSKDLETIRSLTSADDTASNQLLDDIAKRWALVVDARVNVFKDVDAGNVDAATQLLLDTEFPNWQQIRKDLGVLTKDGKAETARLQDAIEQQAERARQLSIWVGLAALLIGLALMVVVMRSVSSRLSTVTRAMHEIATGDGDLRKRLPETGRDEITDLARTFNRFVIKIQDLVREITESSTHLAASAEEMSTITTLSRENTRHQAEQTEMVAVAIDEMTATTKTVAQNTNETAFAAQETDEATRAGKEVLNRSVQSINKLVNHMHKTTEAVHELEGQTTKIGGVLDVIRSVAEQTNLLALNAAIEAARAGEHGRGFAVVAEEVRNLASRTQRSTEEIREIIEQLQQRVSETATAMEISEAHGQETIKLTGETDELLDVISTRVNAITQMTLQIAAATEEQSAAAAEINQNLSKIRVQSEHLDDSAEQVSIAGSDLTRLASSLDQQVGRFKA
ncbi:MAG TPA: methyl-accepting chemotaxis protein [Halothiobacillus sp.]|nr:methyl-accepting chemotaxis protein [Halothiobacillus sp.]